MKVVTIETCYQCPYYQDLPRYCRNPNVEIDGEFRKGKFIPYSKNLIRSLMGESFSKTYQIPKWCPLEDAK